MSGNIDERVAVERAEQRAAELGLQVVRPEKDELFVDLDSSEQMLLFKSRLPDISKFISTSAVTRASSSGEEGHYHAYVRLNRPVKSEEERILLQLLLGSDPTRELLSWARIQICGSDCATVFYEKPDVKKPEYEPFQEPHRQVRLED